MEAETWGAFLMTFLLVELAGRQERGEIPEGSDQLDGAALNDPDAGDGD